MQRRKNGYQVMLEVLSANGSPHSGNERALIDDDDKLRILFRIFTQRGLTFSFLLKIMKDGKNYRILKFFG
jgi:hypothetical protein